MKNKKKALMCTLCTLCVFLGAGCEKKPERAENKLGYISMCKGLLAVEQETEAEKIISPFRAVQQMTGRLHMREVTVFLIVVRCTCWYRMSRKIGSSGEFDSGMTNDNHGASVIVDALDGTLYYYDTTISY